MSDDFIKSSVNILAEEYERALKANKDSFNIHVSFFNGLDKDSHLRTFRLKYPVRYVQ